ncbi:hypothetical protein N1851_006671 [Merluccius polli]|uniref:DDE Tnp4 domain-containing protein n=1 Tax=Merluccius polli TaxID=89951 RepID=A0AA47PA83_MERPO|nr:hypothetical protein N1851_006671 [Merluccius polli]
MPAKFKEQFPNTFAILDGTELKIEKPRSLVLQSQTYSTYKSTNTLKSLVACDPRGAVIYVSALFTGSISDKEIFNRCNIIDILKGCVQCGYPNIKAAVDVTGRYSFNRPCRSAAADTHLRHMKDHFDRADTPAITVSDRVRVRRPHRDNKLQSFWSDPVQGVRAKGQETGTIFIVPGASEW